jgi:hypothetical protein
LSVVVVPTVDVEQAATAGVMESCNRVITPPASIAAKKLRRRDVLPNR